MQASRGEPATTSSGEMDCPTARAVPHDGGRLSALSRRLALCRVTVVSQFADWLGAGPLGQFLPLSVALRAAQRLMRDRSILARRLATLLDLRALPFCFQPASLRATGAPGRTTDRRRHHGIAKQDGQSFPRGSSVASLGPVFGGADGERRARQPCGEPLEHKLALRIRQGCRGADVETELHT